LNQMRIQALVCACLVIVASVSAVAVDTQRSVETIRAMLKLAPRTKNTNQVGGMTITPADATAKTAGSVVTTSPNVVTATEKTCSSEVQRCAGGQTVARDPFNNCNFFPCGGQLDANGMCQADLYLCPGTNHYVRRYPKNKCAFQCSSASSLRLPFALLLSLIAAWCSL